MKRSCPRALRSHLFCRRAHSLYDAGWLSSSILSAMLLCEWRARLSQATVSVPASAGAGTRISPCPARSYGFWFLVLRKLILQPLVQIVHHRRAVRLMKRQPFFRREAALFRFGVEAVYGTQRLQHIPAFFGEVRGNVYNLPPSMRQTVGQKDFHTRQLRRVPRGRASHI